MNNRSSTWPILLVMVFAMFLAGVQSARSHRRETNSNFDPGSARKTANLSDLTDASAARSNLGVSSASDSAAVDASNVVATDSWLSALNLQFHYKIAVASSGRVGIFNNNPVVGLHLGSGNPNRGLSADHDFYLGGKLEVDGLSYFDSSITAYSYLTSYGPHVMRDDINLYFGAGSDFYIKYVSANDRIDMFDAGSVAGLSMHNDGSITVATTTKKIGTKLFVNGPASFTEDVHSDGAVSGASGTYAAISETELLVVALQHTEDHFGTTSYVATFASELYDVDNALALGSYTVPITGWYEIAANHTVRKTTADSIFHSIYKDNVLYVPLYGGGENVADNELAQLITRGMVYATAGEVITIKMNCGAGTAEMLNGYGSLTIKRVPVR